MLSNGNDRVPPSHGMWPLLCNEVGLSYDQEERVRSIQRLIVHTPETWVDRHSGAASCLVMQTSHDCLQALQSRTGVRERYTASILTESQRLKLLQWAASKREALARRSERKVTEENDGYTMSPKNHLAANLYIMNHRLQKALNKLPTPPALVVGVSMKRLSRRPSFESLGSVGALSEKNEDSGLSRESSFSSTGSLKRSASEMSLDEENRQAQSVSAVDGETAAKPTVEAALGFVKDILPLRSQPKPDSVPSFAVSPPTLANTPAPVPVVPNHPYQSQEHQMMQPPHPQPVTSAPVTWHQQQPLPSHQHQQPIRSFLPHPLNAVPEEEFLAQQGSDPADEFLFELAEEDWAIGEGFDMDAT